jgi:hypothetical protein
VQDREERDGFKSIEKIVPQAKVFSESTQIHLVALREAVTSAVLICLHYQKVSPRKKQHDLYFSGRVFARADP